MNAPSKITRPTTAELLTAIINAKRLIDARGDLADAPTEWLNALDDGGDAAGKLLEWLNAQKRPCMSLADWTGASSYPGVL